MKVRFLLGLFAGLTLALSAYGQDANGSIKVVNDPLFWRSDLKLTRKQVIEIENVNTGFYESLKSAIIEENQASNRQQLRNLLERRSNSIWNVFSTRQRSKWMRIQEARNERGLRRLLPRMA